MGNPDWKGLADATLRLWHEVGWIALLGAGCVALAWKFIDSWGKKPKG